MVEMIIKREPATRMSEVKEKEKGKAIGPRVKESPTRIRL
jgi:hypothetical protein